MSITRRTLLRTVASLSAAHSLSGFAFSPPTKPKSTSIYVLFEGPWLFYPTGNDMTALAAGESIPPYMHDCLYGLGTPNSKNIKDPKIFDNGKTFAANVTNATRANSFTEAFQVPFATNPFLWITGQAPYVTPRAYDRVVTLPLPSNIYVAGKLKTAVVTQGTQSLKPPTTGLAAVRPYVVTILEYAPSGAAHVGLTLTDSATPRIFTPNDHLIFRLMHKSVGPGTPADDAKHVKDAFDDLIARVTTTGTPLQIAPTDSSCDVGTDTGGFDQDELGLDPSGLLDRMRKPSRRRSAAPHTEDQKRLMVSNFANCAGGGGPVGP
jgi:hypothetical protein